MDFKVLKCRSFGSAVNYLKYVLFTTLLTQEKYEYAVYFICLTS